MVSLILRVLREAHNKVDEVGDSSTLGCRDQIQREGEHAVDNMDDATRSVGACELEIILDMSEIMPC